MHRFFVVPDCFVGDRVVLPENIAHQIRNVLRLRPGAAIVVLDNTGWEYEVLLRQVDRQQVVGEAVAKRPSPNEPAVQLTLYQALMKRDKFEWVLQKGTEIGVTHFVPLVTQRSLVQDVDIKEGKQLRWEKIITEAAEQSRRGCIPMLHPPQTLAEALAAHGAQPGLIAWEEAAGLDDSWGIGGWGTAVAHLPFHWPGRWFCRRRSGSGAGRGLTGRYLWANEYCGQKRPHLSPPLWFCMN
jgi:16S rRNA (uracil1498-N3)-methyltransferase